MSALSLDDYRAYLLSIANSRLRTDLRPKLGGSDLVQETLLAAWTCRAEAPMNPDALRYWLRGILRNRITSNERRYVAARRSVVAERSLVDLAAVGDEPGQEVVAEDALVLDEQAAALRAAIEKLRPHECEVLEWRLQDDFSWQEIATRLDSTAEAARQVFRRALAQLRGLLSPGLDPGCE